MEKREDCSLYKHSNPENWVDEHANYLYSFAIARIENNEIVRDLIQETFLAGLEGLSKFEGKSSAKTWLTAILKNKITDFYRQQFRQGINLPLGIDSEDLEYFDPQFNRWKKAYWPNFLGVEDKDLLDNKDLNEILQNCMKKLPSLWFNIFKMKYLDDMGTAAICEELKISKSNYWVIMHRAKANLRSCAQKFDP